MNSTSGEYILRVLGSTRERGFYASTEDLLQLVNELCNQKITKSKWNSQVDKSFRGTVACVGNPLLREEQVKTLILANRVLEQYSWNKHPPFLTFLRATIPDDICSLKVGNLKHVPIRVRFPSFPDPWSWNIFQGAVRVDQPFQMTVSRGCIGYYKSVYPNELSSY